MDNDFLLIGLDGGATKVSGWNITFHGDKFRLGEHNVVVSYKDNPDYSDKFRPVNIQNQITEYQSGQINPTKEEIHQGQIYIKAAAETVIDLVKKTGSQKVLIGEGMPGLKTADIRGVAVMANGPRIIDYCDQMEMILKQNNIELVRPIAKLGSDAFYCGVGEEYASQGQFKNVDNSYYLGGGTGAADALKLGGNLVSLDDIKDWFVKAWEMKNRDEISLEKCASAKGIQEIYGNFAKISLADLNKREIYPHNIRERALKNEKAAIRTFNFLADNLALLIYERITTIYSGWSDIFNFVNPNRVKPKREHPFHGTRLDSIIIGQRLGDLFQISRGDSLLWEPFFQELSSHIIKSEVLDQQTKEYYCPDGNFNQDLLVISKLREAPALGAGIDAFLTLNPRENY